MLSFKSLAFKACAKPNLYVASQRMFSSTTYENIIVEKQDGGVAQITLNRPKALNALCLALFNDLHAALKELDQDPEIGCIVLTGSQKAFAAGADIKEMSERQYPDTFVNHMLTWWD